MGGEERVEIPVQAEVGAFLTQALKFRAGIGYDPQPQCAQTIWQSMPLLMLDPTQLSAHASSLPPRPPDLPWQVRCEPLNASPSASPATCLSATSRLKFHKSCWPNWSTARMVAHYCAGARAEAGAVTKSRGLSTRNACVYFYSALQ